MLTNLDSKQKDEYTRLLRQKIEQEGYDVGINYSKTDFGQSNYLYVRLSSAADNYSNVVKIRISDHSVSNFNRMFDEVHLGFPNELTDDDINSSTNYLLKEIQFKLEREKYFTKQQGQDKNIVNMEVNDVNLRPTDIVLSERESSGRRGAGRKVYRIERVSYIPTTEWVNNKTGRVFASYRDSLPIKRPLFANGGNILNFEYSIGGL